MPAIYKNGKNYSVGTTVDSALSSTSTNPVQNKVVKQALDGLILNFANYYNKTEVDSIVNAIKNSRFEAVSTLPTTDIKTNVIYLVPKSPTQTNNAKDEYINLDGTSSGWEKIGDTEIDLSGYVTTTALNTALSDYTTTADLTTLLNNKIDKVQDKGLSTNDYTDDDKNKLAGIEAGANKTVVDFFMNADSTNPLQNRVVNAFLNEKTDINNFNALTQEIELFNTYDLSNDVEISVFANDTYKRDKYDRAYETHVPNLDGEYSVSLGDKTFTETCTFTIANQGTSITETFHTNRKYILGAKLLKAENDEVGDAHVIADVVTLIISKDAPYTTTFDTTFKKPPVTGVLTLKVSVKPDEKYVNKENTGGPAEYAYWGSYNGSDLLINNPILTYSETTFGQPKVSGNPITINDAAEANLVECVAEIEAVQDLHGYDAPWAGGAGKNKLPMTVDGIKADNTSGTWSGNTYTYNGVSFTVETDDDENVTGFTVNGTASATSFLRLKTDMTLPTGSYIVNGCPNGGGVGSYSIRDSYIGVFSDNGNGQTFSYTSGRMDAEIYVASGYNAQNLIFLPMIRLATETDPTFEPYSNISPISGWDEANVGVSGVNIWDEQTELGIYDQTTGEKQNYTGYSRSVNKIRIEGGTQYYLKLGQGLSHVRVFYYTANSYISTIPLLSGLFTPPNNAEYMTFQFSGTTYNHDISINCPSTNTEYHAYNGKTYTIQLGQTVYKARVNATKGIAELIGAEVDLGSLTWTKRTVNNYTIFFSDNTLSKKNNILCSCYKAVVKARNNLNNGEIGTWNTSNSFECVVRDDTKADLTEAQFKTAVTGQTLVYELATPYTIQLTPQQIRLLKGTNNLSCNTGDLSIKYYPDNVLGQLKGDIEGEYDERVETLETQVQELQPSLIFMSRERRDITSDLSRLSIAVAEQNLEKYGYKIGDYFERVDGDRTYTYHIADYNTFKGTSTPYCLTTNHIGIVVDTHATTQWYSGDASAVGYNGSTLHTYLKGTVLDNIKADMIYFFGGSTGLEHLIAHSKLFTTALANWGWQANQYISALTCTQIDAGSQWTANEFQEGEASKSLELFRKHKWTEIFESRHPWLRNLSNYGGGSNACCANDYGLLHGYYGVTIAYYVVGLIIFH